MSQVDIERMLDDVKGDLDAASQSMKGERLKDPLSDPALKDPLVESEPTSISKKERRAFVEIVKAGKGEPPTDKRDRRTVTQILSNATSDDLWVLRKYLKKEGFHLRKMLQAWRRAKVRREDRALYRQTYDRFIGRSPAMDEPQASVAEPSTADQPPSRHQQMVQKVRAIHALKRMAAEENDEARARDYMAKRKELIIEVTAYKAEMAKQKAE